MQMLKLSLLINEAEKIKLLHLNVKLWENIPIFVFKLRRKAGVGERTLRENFKCQV